MKTAPINNSNSKDFKVDLEFLLRTNGFLFPETVHEVSEYERTFGDTDIILPDDMQEPTFLKEAFSRMEISNNIVQIKSQPENCSLAARDDAGEQLPDHIRKRMDDDRDKLKS
jgi:hypothetical protein